jgi:type 1 glutamine amidotransferase
MKKILLVTDGLFHPPLTARTALRRLLEEPDSYRFKHIHSLEKLPADLTSYAAIVIYIHHKKISEAALEKLDLFVAAGGGVLGVHSATASFKQAPQYFEILGGRFIGHGPVEKFTVKPVDQSEVFSGIPAFDVFDELYLHEFQPDIEVHFTAHYKGEDVPAVWTYTFGKGRVCYAAPGHRTASLKNETYQKLLRQGLKWVTSE